MKKARCTAAVWPPSALTTNELGKIAGNMGADILEGKAKPADMPIQYQKEFKVKVNEPVLKTLGLQLPESLKGKAELGDFH